MSKIIRYKDVPESERLLQSDAIMSFSNKEKIKVVEIGTLNGESARHFLKVSEKVHLLSIDPFIPDSMESTLIGDISKVLKNTEFAKDRFSLHAGYSYDKDAISQAKSFNPDIIFIDGSHLYNDVVDDISTYAPILSKGGLLMMHDSRMNRKGGAPFHVGSSKATDEMLFNNPDWGVFGEAFSLSVFEKLY